MITNTPTIHGKCDEKFAKVKEAFAKNFAERNDVGASVAITYQGEFVVDLWAGHREAEKTKPWQEDTIINVYSTTKTMAALTMLLLADRGELNLHERVGKYWPEYACNGKEQTQVRHFLSHSAGLSGMDEPAVGEQLADWDYMAGALARQKPWWQPGGKQSGYHALTQGYLIGEVVRRITGMTLGNFFRQEIAEPLQADFHIGTSKSVHERIATLIAPKTTPVDLQSDKDSIAARTFANPAISVQQAGSNAWREAEIPAANGHGNARSVVRVQTLMANGGTAWGKSLMSEQGCKRALEEQTNSVDLVLGIPMRFGMGYGLATDLIPLGPNENVCFWGGYGGSSIIVDMDARLCISYVMNYMEGGLLGDPRGFSLAMAAFDSLSSN